MSEKINYPIYSVPSPDSSTLFQALATVITSSYALIGEETRADGATTAFLHIYWTKGDETSIEVKCEWALTSGGTTVQETIAVTTDADGKGTIKAADYTFSTASDNIVIPFRVMGRFANFYIKATGGTPTGTYGAGIHLMRE